MRRPFLFTYLILLLFALALPAEGAPAAQPKGAMPASPAAARDLLGRETPRSMISGLISALAEHDYDRAAQYIDIPAKSHRQRVNAAAQAQAFEVLLDNGGSLKPYVALSNEATGKIDDSLPIDQEHVGEISLRDKKIPVLLTRGEDRGQPVWRISHETISQVAEATNRIPAVDRNSRERDQDAPTFAGAPLEDWALLLGLGVLIFGGLWAIFSLFVSAVRRLIPSAVASGGFRFFEAALPPLSLLIAVGVFFGWAEQLPVSIVARQAMLRYTGIVSLIALVWFGLRLADAIAELVIVRMQRRQRRQAVSVVTLLRRSVKALLLLFSCIGVLDTFGIDVTTGIAALGIGGIALALGAQKTVENLVGSVTLIADRPAQVGDFIKVGDITGTVEDVGIRSTRIRTGERTVVTIPNGDLSARQIENFAARDRFLFNPVIAVDCTTSSAKLKEAVDIIQQVLSRHDQVEEGARANLAKISERSFNIDVHSYIDVSEFDASVIIRQELLLSMYGGLEAAGIGLAFPGQTISLRPEQLDAILRQRQTELGLDAPRLEP